MEVCSSLGCLSPRASTDALLPSFQPDDDDDDDDDAPAEVKKSPQAAEHSPLAYPGPTPQFPRRLSRSSPRLADELYPGPGRASYAGHSPRPGPEVAEAAAAAVRPASYSEPGTRSSPHSPAIVVEDLTSHSKPDPATADPPQSHRQSAGDGNPGRDSVRSSMDLLRVDTSPAAISRPSRDTTANCVS